MDQSDPHAILLAAYLAKRADLVRFFTIRLRSEGSAEDLVQDIYLKIASVDTGTELHSPVAYLYRLGSNLMLDRLRGERRRTVRDSDWRTGHQVQVGQEDVMDEPAVEDAISARQRLAQVVEALSALPPLTRTIFRMHKFEGRTHLEVAHALGISRSSVEKHVSSVLKHLVATVGRP